MLRHGAIREGTFQVGYVGVYLEATAGVFGLSEEIHYQAGQKKTAEMSRSYNDAKE